MPVPLIILTLFPVDMGKVMSYLLKPTLLMLCMLSLGNVSSNVMAEACTFREALMAIEKGNTVRGMALMRMASRDEDLRATEHLMAKDFQINSVSMGDQQLKKPTLSLNKVKSE